MNHHHNLFLFIIRSLKLNKCLFVQFIHFEVVFENTIYVRNLCDKICYQWILQPLFTRMGEIILTQFPVYLSWKQINKKEDEQMKDNKSLIWVGLSLLYL